MCNSYTNYLDDGESPEDLEAELAERDKVLIAMDTIAFKKACNHPDMSEEIAICAMHKARYTNIRIPKELRHESAKWLRDRGYGWQGQDILPEGQLPC